MFSRREVIDLAKSTLLLGIAFSVLFSGFRGFIGGLAESLLVVAFAFLAHELAHKLAAQHFGCRAEYRSNDTMLLFAVLFSFFGFIFAAPGAVWISGRPGVRENGIISLAGPLTNIVVAFALTGVFARAALVSAWIGLFNLIPLINFDGRKVLAWSKPAYFAVLLSGIAAVLMQ